MHSLPKGRGAVRPRPGSHPATVKEVSPLEAEAGERIKQGPARQCPRVWPTLFAAHRPQQSLTVQQQTGHLGRVPGSQTPCKHRAVSPVGDVHPERTRGHSCPYNTRGQPGSPNEPPRHQRMLCRAPQSLGSSGDPWPPQAGRTDSRCPARCPRSSPSHPCPITDRRGGCGQQGAPGLVRALPQTQATGRPHRPLHTGAQRDSLAVLRSTAPGTPPSLLVPKEGP